MPRMIFDLPSIAAQALLSEANNEQSRIDAIVEFALCEYLDATQSKEEPDDTARSVRQIPQRRQFERAQADLPVTYAITGKCEWHEGRLISLSGGGVRISGARDLVQSSEITLRFCLPGAQREICTYGRIVMSFFDGSTQRYSHGVAFTRIAGSDQNAIVNYVDNVLLANLRFLRAVDVNASGETSAT